MAEMEQLTGTVPRGRLSVLTEDEQLPGVLLTAVAGGDLDAFSALYDMFARPVFAVALRATSDRQRAEEAVQDTFLKIWRKAQAFDPDKGAAPSWIFTIAKRSAIDVSRREQRAPFPTALTPEDAPVPDANDELTTTWQVNAALSELPVDQRSVIDLFVLQGLTHTEVADRLGLPLGTVKTRIYAGLKRLRETLQQRGAMGVDHEL